MAKPITLSQQVRSGGCESMISANGGLLAHRYTPQVTQRWPRGSEPASAWVRFGGRSPPGWVLLGTASRAVVMWLWRALSGFEAAGSRCCWAPVRVPWSCPAACLSGVPRGGAWCAAPRPLRSLSVLQSAFLTPWCLFRARGCRPRLYWAAARGTRGPAENGAHCACCWPPLRQARRSPTAYMKRTQTDIWCLTCTA